jgi:hypothetical protein
VQIKLLKVLKYHISKKTNQIRSILINYLAIIRWQKVDLTFKLKGILFEENNKTQDLKDKKGRLENSNFITQVGVLGKDRAG